MPALRSDGLPIELAPGLSLSTPGLEGDAALHESVGGTRSVAYAAPAFETSLAEHGYETLRTVEIENARETFAPPGATRTTAYNEEAMVLEVPATNAGYLQVAFMQDEAGLITWNFAERDEPSRDSVLRGTATQRFVLRRYVPPLPPAGAQQRGLIGAIGTKVIKILAFPIGEIAGAVGNSLARSWEADHRPYGLRAVTSETYAAPGGGTPPSPEMWQSYRDQPTLLLVHGTFSTSPSTYGILPKDVFEQLAAAHGGRVLAFDHPTMTETPRQNAEWLLRQVPEEGAYLFDVLTHSRGGLVARTLAEKARDWSTRNVGVRNLVLTAVPDRGTTLTDARYMGDFIDTYTNLLNFFPESVPLDTFHCILAAVKEIAAGTLDHLCGLQSMLPNGEFQRWLNDGPKAASRYYGIGSAFSPSEPGLADWAKQRLMNAIFKEANDLVVPTAGVYAENGSGYFPIADADRLLFGAGDGVWHCNYFTQPKANAKIVEWLCAA